MRIEISVARSGFRLWHQRLAERLARNLDDADVRIRLTAGGPALDSAAEALIQLERMVLRRSRETLADRLNEVPAALRAPDGFIADLRVDCAGPAGRGPAPAFRVLRPLYDGDPSEQALVACVLGRSLPAIEIEDVGTGGIVACGRPSAEAAAGLTGGIEAVATRVMVLVEAAVRSPRHCVGQPSARAPKAKDRVLGFAMRNLAADCARAIYRLCLDSPHWRIGWRLHDGPGVADRGDLCGPRWNILADPGRRFFADPFPVRWAGRTILYFEDFDHRIGKGIISAMEFGPDGPAGEAVPVLEEPWHLSYPFIIEHDGALFMVPECSLSGSVFLYRCTEFPHRWERVGTLLEGVEAADCTIFKHDGGFWMMSATREGVGGYSDMLSIHVSADLAGPWRPHALNPVLIDAGAARPAGRVIARDGRLWRPVQDCSLGYGRSIALASIDRLDPDHFAQTIHHRILPGALWPGRHLHTLNRAARLECIDGTAINPKWAAARVLAERWRTPTADTAPPALQNAPG